jgi:lipid II:glycine glycyltransferase (peptidoglycan interpeptide bridge formation enzyme)
VLIEQEGSVVGGAQLLIRQLPKPFNAIVYVPRGPFGDSSVVLEALPEYVKKRYRPTHIVVEPDSETMVGNKGWRTSTNSILLARTIVLDLTRSEDDLLAAMTKKTRQYIRKSSTDGVRVQQLGAKDVARCLEVYKETARRAQFALHDDSYYHDLHKAMGESSIIFGAYEGETLLAFVWLVATPEVAFELYGGVTDRGQELRANYALKWHAIKKSRQWGIAHYDMNGLLNDGVSTFKQGFANHETNLAGTYDYPLSPLYSIWTRVFPAAKKALQKLKRR